MSLDPSITPELDHLVFACTDLARGAIWMEDMLGVAPQSGGVHQGRGTHNRLWGMGDAYIELIAPDPNQAEPERPRLFGLSDPQTREAIKIAPLLLTYVVRCADIEARAATAPFGPVESMARGDLNWKMTIPEDGQRTHHGILPSLIEWSDEAQMPSHNLGVNSRLRLRQLSQAVDDVASRDIAAAGLGHLVSIVEGLPTHLQAVIDTPDGEVFFSGLVV